MKSIVRKSGIIAAMLVLLHCVNNPPSTLHPVLSLTEKKVNDASQVTVATAAAESYSLYRVVDDVCTLRVHYHALIDGMRGVADSSHAVANDSAASGAGRFYGAWVAPESLYSSIIMGTDTIITAIPIDTIRISGCVTDETGHEACASLMLVKDTTLSKTGYQAY